MLGKKRARRRAFPKAQMFLSSARGELHGVPFRRYGVHSGPNILFALHKVVARMFLGIARGAFVSRKCTLSVSAGNGKHMSSAVIRHMRLVGHHEPELRHDCDGNRALNR